MSLPDSFDATRALHITIDVQQQFLCKLPGDLSTAFPTRVRSFADAIKPYIKTLNIGTRLTPNDAPSYKFYEAAGSQQPNLIKAKQLGISIVATDEDLFEKTNSCAFTAGKLEEELYNRFPQLQWLIFTGLNSSACIPATIVGAIKHNYSCLGIIDLMADCNTKDRALENNNDPEWHRQTLIRFSRQYTQPRDARHWRKKSDHMPIYKSVLSADIITALNEKPAPPMKGAPVLNAPNRSCD